jgi:ubiquinone/menaquinone biosynthesis C-methylase UbiE
MDYDRSEMPSAYDAGRSYAPRVLAGWLETVSRHVQGPVSRILDLGCGTGRYSSALARYFDADVEAVDPSEKMLEQALKKPHARVRFRKASGEELPLEDESVDLVFMSMVFHHLDSPESVARECRRVLRTNGSVCLRAATSDQIPGYAYVRFFSRSASIMEGYFQSREFVESVFAQADLAPIHHELVASEVASDWTEYASKLEHRADSVLVQLRDSEFQEGLAAVKRHAQSHTGDGPVTELVDFFVFRRLNTSA